MVDETDDEGSGAPSTRRPPSPPRDPWAPAREPAPAGPGSVASPSSIPVPAIPIVPPDGFTSPGAPIGTSQTDTSPGAPAAGAAPWRSTPVRPVDAAPPAPWTPPSGAPMPPPGQPPAVAPTTTILGAQPTQPAPSVAPSGPLAAPRPLAWSPTGAGPGMPSAPPQYDPGIYGTPFGAAGGAPPEVPRLPGGVPAGADRAPAGGGSTRAAVLVGVLSAVLASLVTGGLFVAYGRSEQTTAGKATPATSTAGPRGTLVGPLDIYTLLERAQPSVVSIRTNVAGSTSTRELGEAGSGVVISDDGLVLTNAHVISGAASIKVTLDDGSTKTATLVGSNPDDDIALIKIKDASGLQPAELGSSEDIKVGDPVVAIGNALNLGSTPSVTEGIVSAKNRDIQTSSGTIKNLIQTDAAINPGNSGGPLLNAGGQVVGINTAIIEGAQNIGFAISIDSIKPLIEDLKAGKGTVTPDSAFLGVSTQSIGDVNAATLERYAVTATAGAFVSDVVTGSAAEQAGLQPGDVITSIDGQAISGASDVGAVIRKKQAGDTVTIEYEREGRKQTVTVTLQSRSKTGG